LRDIHSKVWVNNVPSRPPVHEHLIIGDNTYFSFADHGHIAEMNREYEAAHRQD